MNLKVAGFQPKATVYTTRVPYILSSALDYLLKPNGEILSVKRLGCGTIQHFVDTLREQGILNGIGHGKW